MCVVCSVCLSPFFVFVSVCVSVLLNTYGGDLINMLVFVGVALVGFCSSARIRERSLCLSPVFCDSFLIASRYVYFCFNLSGFLFSLKLTC